MAQGFPKVIQKSPPCLAAVLPNAISATHLIGQVVIDSAVIDLAEAGQGETDQAETGKAVIVALARVAALPNALQDRAASQISVI